MAPLRHAVRLIDNGQPDELPLGCLAEVVPKPLALEALWRDKREQRPSRGDGLQLRVALPGPQSLGGVQANYPVDAIAFEAFSLVID